MTRVEFMRELARLLQEIPAEEREEALQYYEGYFEDAGPDAEAEVIRELESPEKVADMVKAGVNGTGEGQFTECGYEEPGREKAYQVMNRKEEARQDKAFRDGAAGTDGAGSGTDGAGQGGSARWEEKEGTRPVQRSNGWRTAFWILLAVFTFPIWIGAAAVAFGALMVLIVGGGGLLFGLAAGAVALTGGFLISGVSLTVAGVGAFFAAPFSGFLLFSGGLLMIGLGLLALCLTVLVVWKVVPVCVKGFINLCSWPFRKRRAAV